MCLSPSDPHVPHFLMLVCWWGADWREVGSGAGSLWAGRVNGLWADEILSVSALPGIRPPCPIFPLFIPLTACTLAFNFPWVFTARHRLRSEFQSGVKFGEITSFLFFFFFSSLNLTESKSVAFASQSTLLCAAVTRQLARPEATLYKLRVPWPRQLRKNLNIARKTSNGDTDICSQDVFFFVVVFLRIDTEIRKYRRMRFYSYSLYFTIKI